MDESEIRSKRGEMSTSTKNPKKANILDHHSIKHLFDESVTEVVKSRGYVEDTRLSNVKLLIGSVIITIALFAQFTPKKFPENRDLLLICIGLYVVLNGVLQFISYTKEKNAFLFTYPPAWPGAVFNTDTEACYPWSGKPASNFGIHGLWPTNQKGPYLSHCTEEKYNPSQIRNPNGMKRDWPTFQCPSTISSDFWRREWEKHGTCSTARLNQADYFETCLNLKKNYNLLQLLANAGIKPDGRPYALNDIKQAIKKGTEHEPEIECNFNPMHTINQLFQIYLCIDESSLKPRACPPSTGSRNCRDPTTFPPFK